MGRLLCGNSHFKWNSHAGCAQCAPLRVGRPTDFQAWFHESIRLSPQAESCQSSFSRPSGPNLLGQGTHAPVFFSFQSAKRRGPIHSGSAGCPGGVRESSGARVTFVKKNVIDFLPDSAAGLLRPRLARADYWFLKLCDVRAASSIMGAGRSCGLLLRIWTPKSAPVR